jgi:predicted outer membrane protein
MVRAFADEGGAVRTRPIRQVFAHAVAVVAVLGVVFGALAACGSSEQTELPPPAAPAQPGAPADQQGAGGQSAALGPAGQGAAALAALGGLGQAQGATPAVRDLGGQLATEGQALVDQLQQSAGGAIAAEPTAEQQTVLADLEARTGEQFDPAWLRAAMQMQQEVRDAANAVLADENASDEAKAGARDALARLDALGSRIEQAASSAGAQAPAAVDAGSGGQAAGDVTPLAAAVVGVGVALLAGALWRRRRSA